MTGLRSFVSRRGVAVTAAALCAVVVFFCFSITTTALLRSSGFFPSFLQDIRFYFARAKHRAHRLPIIANVKVFVLTAVGCVAPVRAGRANKARGNDPINLDNKIT